MRIQTCISSRARQLLVILVADVASCTRVFVPLGQSEVDYVDYVLVVAHSYQEVVRLDVPMEEAALVNELDALQHLDGEHKDGFKTELASTVLIEVL